MVVLRRAPDALDRRVLRGVLVLPADADEPLLISPPGDLIWELIAEPLGLDELVDELAARFDSERETIAADVSALIDTLVAEGAVLVDE